MSEELQNIENKFCCNCIHWNFMVRLCKKKNKQTKSSNSCEKHEVMK